MHNISKTGVSYRVPASLWYKSIIIIVGLFATTLHAQHFASEPSKDTEIDASIDLIDLGVELDFFAVCRNVISTRMGGLEYIYRKHKKDDKTFLGQIMVKIIVTQEGVVSRCDIVRSQLKSIDFQKEIKEKIQTWRFGRLAQNSQEVLIPFYFK